ncbi:hypothetical protein [Demequina sp.]|uniref:hypothetical protein n=1 Tax=Demequina sp. TaxID=2050685 RepID=UPI003D0DAE4C
MDEIEWPTPTQWLASIGVRPRTWTLPEPYLPDVRLDEPGLYAVYSDSASVYYLDTRTPESPMLYRARGVGHTLVKQDDDQWLPLTSVTAIPAFLLDPDDEGEMWALSNMVPNVVSVGCRHRWTYISGATDIRGPIPLFISRTCETIVRLNEMPHGGEWTIRERWTPKESRP